MDAFHNCSLLIQLLVGTEFYNQQLKAVLAAYKCYTLQRSKRNRALLNSGTEGYNVEVLYSE